MQGPWIVPPIASSWAYKARTLRQPPLGLRTRTHGLLISIPNIQIKYPRRLDIFHLYARSISYISSQTINQSNFFATRLANQSNFFLPQGWLINQTVLPPYWLINQSFCHKADFIETFATRLAD